MSGWSALRFRRAPVAVVEPEPDAEAAAKVVPVDTAEGRILDAMRDPRRLVRHLVAGATIGGITGMSFALLEAVQSNASQPLAGVSKLATQNGVRGVTLSTSVFAAFFGAYHCSKFLCEQARQKDDAGNIILASGVAFTPMLATPWLRGRMPYGVLLVFMDYINTQVLNREFKD